MRAPSSKTGTPLVAVAMTLAACTVTTNGSGTHAPSGTAAPTLPSSTAASSTPASSTPASSTPASSTPAPSSSVAPSELPAAAAIPGVVYKPETDRGHVSGVVRYDSDPPTGGKHSGYWADCTGTVYPSAIANENAVHMLEHGAVWVTYRAGLATEQVATLSGMVAGVDHSALSPYPDLRSNISVQSWGYQLVVDDAADPRVAQFFDLLRENPGTTPEPGATCSQPTFKQHPSTFGHPLDGP